jgi:hypothetical protein
MAMALKQGASTFSSYACKLKNTNSKNRSGNIYIRKSLQTKFFRTKRLRKSLGYLALLVMLLDSQSRPS